jgi:hypothetical protein
LPTHMSFRILLLTTLRCDRWILSVPPTFAGFSRYSPLSLDSLNADASQIRSLGSFIAYHCRWILSVLTSFRYARWIPSLLLTTLAGFSQCQSHSDTLAGFCRLLWILSLLNRMRSLDPLVVADSEMRSLDFLGSSGFCRCSPRCARRILPAPPDSLAAHPDALAGFSRLLAWMRSLDALGLSGFSRCSPGCARWILSAPLDSLVAPPGRARWVLLSPLDSVVAQLDPLAGFSRSSRLTDALAGLSRCSPRGAR